MDVSQSNTNNIPNDGVMTMNMHFHFVLPTSKISAIKVRTSMVIISLTRRHTLLGCETNAMETKALIPLVGPKVCLEGG